MLMLPADATEDIIESLRAAYGLDKPLIVRYFKFLFNFVQGEFPNSIRLKEPALKLVLERLPATMELALAALALATFIGIVAGVIAAIRAGTLTDTIVMFIALGGQATPNYWLGLMMILLFAVVLHWFPSGGAGGIKHLFLPALTLSFNSMAKIARFVRSSMLEVLNEDYIQTARAKGLREVYVIFKHALRNALIGPITMIGLEVALLLGGAVVIETVFAWPGVGRLVIQSIYSRDFPVVIAALFIISTLYVFINLLVDLTYSLINPRITYS